MELSKEEMFEVGRQINPLLSRETFDAQWLDFCALQAWHTKDRRSIREQQEQVHGLRPA